MRKIFYYISVLRLQPRKIRFLLSRILWHTGLGRLLKIERRGYKLFFFPTALSATLWLDANSYLQDENFLENYLRPGDLFIDIGANIGPYTLKAADIVGETGKVVAFEPHPRIFQFLTKNVCLNKFRNVECIPVALGNKNTKVYFSDYKTDDQNRVMEKGGVTVDIQKLDHYALGAPALIKIDTEGYEKLVLEGGSATLAKTECIVFECWESLYKKYGYSTYEVIASLKNLDFVIFQVAGERKLKKLPCEYTSDFCENLVAIRDVERFIERTGYQILDVHRK